MSGKALILLLLVIYCVDMQAQNVKYGATLDLNTSWISNFSTEQLDEADIKGNVGWGIGCYLKLLQNEAWSLRSELSWNNRGYIRQGSLDDFVSSYPYGELVLDEKVTLNTNINYISMQLFAERSIPVFADDLYGIGGLWADYQVNYSYGKFEAKAYDSRRETTVDLTIKDGTARILDEFGWGVTAGIGKKLFKIKQRRLFLELLYYMEISDRYSSFSNYAVRNRSVDLTVGIEL